MRAWLQKRPHALGTAALDKPEMAAMRAGHRFDYDARFPEVARSNDEAVVPPFHAGVSPLTGCLRLAVFVPQYSLNEVFFRKRYLACSPVAQRSNTQFKL
jgi:hypothetical protein